MADMQGVPAKHRVGTAPKSSLDVPR
jgi:hypothetical protein